MDLAASIQAVTGGGRAAADACARGRDRRRRISASPAAWRSTASPTARSCATGASSAIWIQPAAGDAGGALGAALAAYHLYSSSARELDGNSRRRWRAPILGPAFEQRRDRASACARQARASRSLDDDELFERTVDALAGGKAVGWFQGRMEFGPRALGARSILGDAALARRCSGRSICKVKYRESFRPFAPAVLREDVGEWFDLDTDSPLHAAGRRRAPSDRRRA